MVRLRVQQQVQDLQFLWPGSILRFGGHRVLQETVPGAQERVPDAHHGHAGQGGHQAGQTLQLLRPGDGGARLGAPGHCHWQAAARLELLQSQVLSVRDHVESQTSGWLLVKSTFLKIEYSK